MAGQGRGHREVKGIPGSVNERFEGLLAKENCQKYRGSHNLIILLVVGAYGHVPALFLYHFLFENKKVVMVSDQHST
ncbi:hypothetical protein [Desulfobulbus alkaliphilus]|uniref:hypothetical protein n=1 Tax=Desulfobulbus alkaliphilus TaxID=869814 RepID=UPI00196464E3|nr:hypothetical protein [Desulfobulbus alkaliphilus]MBM9537825.1 hypothetical protein [Desulfobulbus alkaliphilus]